MPTSLIHAAEHRSMEYVPYHCGVYSLTLCHQAERENAPTLALAYGCGAFHGIPVPAARGVHIRKQKAPQKNAGKSSGPLRTTFADRFSCPNAF